MMVVTVIVITILQFFSHVLAAFVGGWLFCLIDRAINNRLRVNKLAKKIVNQTLTNYKQ